MSNAAKRASIRAVIKLLCEQFPKTFSRDSPRPLKVGVHADVLAALPGVLDSHDLKSALRAYTSNRRYLHVLLAGQNRVGLDGETSGIVTAEDEAFASARLTLETEPAKPANKAAASPAAKTPAAAPPSPTVSLAGAESDKTPARSGSTSKRLSLADLREAGRRRREAGTSF